MHAHMCACICMRVRTRRCQAGTLGVPRACVCTALAMCISGHVWDLAARHGCFAWAGGVLLNTCLYLRLWF